MDQDENSRPSIMSVIAFCRFGWWLERKIQERYGFATDHAQRN
jgi:hypothetical protein